MLGLLAATLWRRRTQTVLLLLFAAVAATGAAAAPEYAVASLRTLAVASAADAPPLDRIIEVRVERRVGADLAADLRTLAGEVREAVPLPGVTAVGGAAMVGVLGSDIETLAYRDGVCDHLAIEGTCPRAAGELLLPAELAARLGLGIGDRIGVRGRLEIPPVPMTVVGRYRPANRLEPYWGRQPDPSERLAEVGVFTVPATFTMLGANTVFLGMDLVVTPQAYRDADATALAATAEAGGRRLDADAMTVTSALRGLADRIDAQQRTIVTGVAVGVADLLVVCWFALFLAIRRTAQAWQVDIALLKLRGTRRWQLWLLATGQTVVPLTIGCLAGPFVGPSLAHRLAGPYGDAGRWVWAAAGVAVAGAALVALAAQRRSLAAPVAALGRVIGDTRPGVVALVVDAIVVLLALAGAYQALTAGGSVPGIGLLAPLLLALAVGVLAARIVPLLAGRVGAGALREGRVGTGLAALHLSRRPGTASVVGVVVVVVATLLMTASTWSAASAAYQRRAVAEVGADTVLTVTAASPGRLLAAVRAADPDGHSAMAVVRTEAAVGPVLAVDTTRLAAVASMMDGYGLGDWASVARALRPAGFAPVVLESGAFVLDATWSAAGGAAPRLSGRLETADGATTLDLGPVVPGRHRYAAATPACLGGCRLAALTLTTTVDRPAAGATLVVHAIGGLAPALLADRGRWRASVAAGAQVPEITVGPDGLAIGLGPGAAAGTHLDVSVYAADAPTPLPVLRVEGTRLDRADPRGAVIGSDMVPLRDAGQAAALPEGAVLLADLELADRLTVGPQRPTMQVWLAAGAPPRVRERLVAAGVGVLASVSIPERAAALRALGSAAALRFLLAMAVATVALALLCFAVAATTERGQRGRELAALRSQGMAHATVRRVAYLGHLAVAVVAVGLGLATGVALALAIPAPVAAPADLASHVDIHRLPAGPAAGVALGLLAAFAVVAAVAGAALVRAARRRVGA